MKLSKLMCDSTEGDGKAEIVMDYVMSFSLRHATKEHSNQPILYQYCRYMLYKLLQINMPLEQIVFEDVRVWKEWYNIDLSVEVSLTYEGKQYEFALLIENKYYTPLHNSRGSDGEYHNQLEVYKQRFENHYAEKKRKLKYALVSCLDSAEEQMHIYDEAKNYGFEVFGFYDIIDERLWHEDTQLYTDTESEIFNEFWLRKW